MRRVPALMGALGLLVLAGCTPSAEQNPEPPAAESSEFERIEGTFDAGGCSLYLDCQGSGSPTVVYFHGSAFDPGASSASASRLPSLLREDHRTCVYDRLNVGKSDDQPGLVTGTESVRGLHDLLETAGVESPFVLLGASFGGLIAYQYLMTHPDQVAGRVLLDAAFPDELPLEVHFLEDERFESVDWTASAEKLDQFSVYSETLPLRGAEPDIPVTYLRATPETWTLGLPGYDAAILQAQEAYVSSFPRGVLKEVESPHFMEAAVPEAIAEELELVFGQIVG